MRFLRTCSHSFLSFVSQKVLQSRFAKINSRTNLSTYSSLLTWMRFLRMFSHSFLRLGACDASYLRARRRVISQNVFDNWFLKTTPQKTRQIIVYYY